MVRLLVDRGAYVSAADNDGWTPLHLASERGEEAVVRLLADLGADISAAHNYGGTPLQWASNAGHEVVVRLLADLGADISAADNYGGTPLHWASNAGREVVVRLLADLGADISAADNYGGTPLHWASNAGHEAVVRLLVDLGANASAASVGLLRPGGGSCDAFPTISCQPQMGDLREEVGGSAPAGWGPDLQGEIPNAEKPKAGWRGGWEYQEACLAVLPDQDGAPSGITSTGRRTGPPRSAGGASTGRRLGTTSLRRAPRKPQQKILWAEVREGEKPVEDPGPPGGREV